MGTGTTLRQIINMTDANRRNNEARAYTVNVESSPQNIREYTDIFTVYVQRQCRRQYLYIQQSK